MKLTCPSISISLLFSLVSFTAHATPPETSDAPAAQEHVAVAPKGTLSERQLPKLVFSWDCGNCAHNEKVFPLIEKTYASDAAAAGYTVSESETAEVAITAYRQRPPGVRVMFGIMAGKDILKTRVTFRGKEFVAADYNANAFQGMNNLCSEVSKKVMAQVLADLQAQ